MLKQWSHIEDNILKKEYGTKLVQDINIPNRSYNAKRSRAQFLGLKSALKGQGKRLYSVNEAFFSKPNLLNSYWAGFLAADGCLRERTRGSRVITLGIRLKDYKHLSNFKKDIQFTGPISYDDYGQCTLRIHSKHIFDDLCRNFNLHPNKTSTLKPPILSDRLALSFIAGFFDGDGHFTYTRDTLAMGFTGTKEMLDWICYHVDKFADTGYRIKAVPRYKNIRSNTCLYVFYGQRVNIFCNKILKWCSPPVMERKWDATAHLL